METTEEGLAGKEETMPGVRVPRVRALAEALLRMLPIDGVAVGVRAGPDTAQLVHATDPVVADLDNLQFTLGEGPCIDAFQHGSPVLVPDLEDPTAVERWPGFTREAIAAGAAAAFAFPLQIGAAPFGTVEMYRHTPGPLSGTDVATAVLVTDEMIRTVLDELSGGNYFEPTASNPEPIFGRAEIPQATGMIAVQLDISIPQALAHLRAAAFAASRPVQALAQDVIARRITFTEDPDAR